MTKAKITNFAKISANFWKTQMPQKIPNFTVGGVKIVKENKCMNLEQHSKDYSKGKQKLSKIVKKYFNLKKSSVNHLVYISNSSNCSNGAVGLGDVLSYKQSGQIIMCYYVPKPVTKIV